jgi:membrane protease YdiL (CAAX protease family)
MQEARFSFRMTKTQLSLGLSWLAVHFIVLPLLLPLIDLFINPEFNAAATAAIYYGVSFVYLLCVMLTFLRREFDALISGKLYTLAAFFGGMLIYLILSYLSRMLFAGANTLFPTPAEEMYWAYQGADRGAALAAYVLLLPIAEELLLRGCVFGAIRGGGDSGGKNGRVRRIAAYAVTAAAACLLHTWIFALSGLNVYLLYYAAGYLPACLALCWCYDFSGSVWTSIFLSMSIQGLTLSGVIL